uniref:Uncharacterized protein n=1 Tax=Mycena chlorophos TaxID=658473 RepID=A0ABQ0LB13_MYCCL|nr:predicted protein [Mycena chlorophos]
MLRGRALHSSRQKTSIEAPKRGILQAAHLPGFFQVFRDLEEGKLAGIAHIELRQRAEPIMVSWKRKQTTTRPPMTCPSCSGSRRLPTADTPSLRSLVIDAVAASFLTLTSHHTMPMKPSSSNAPTTTSTASQPQSAQQDSQSQPTQVVYEFESNDPNPPRSMRSDGVRQSNPMRRVPPPPANKEEEQK